VFGKKDNQRPPQNLTERIEFLNTELERTTTHYRNLGRRNYGFALLLAVSALIASAAIAIGGILFDASGKVLGVIALVPAIATLIGTVLQPQGRSSWHYKKKDKLNALRRRLLYQLPESPSADNVAAIAKEWDGIDDEMNEAWEKNLSIDLSPITRIPRYAGKEGEGN
jgi:hypothetical protein